MSLKDKYYELITAFDNSDPNWVQFVRDHMTIIRTQHSGKMFIDAVTMNTFRYRLEDYLENNKIPQSFAWFILEINQLNSNMEFHDIEYLLMPDYGYLSKLYELYNSTEANKDPER